MQSTSFHLPVTNPVIPSDKALKKNKFNSEMNKLVEAAVNTLNADGLPKATADQERALVRFFRAMSRDGQWMGQNKSHAWGILKAINKLYLSSDNSRIVEKIQKYVRSNHKQLIAYCASDMALLVAAPKGPRQEILCPSLILGSQSPFFDRMLRGAHKEGVVLKASYSGPAKASKPGISLNEISAITAKAFIQLLTTGKSELLGKLTVSEKQEFINYVNLTDTVKVLLPMAKEFLFQNASPELAQEIYHALIAEERSSHRDMIQRQIEKNVEMRILPFITKNNAMAFYQMAMNKESLLRVRLACLSVIVGEISVQEAHQGVMKGTISRFDGIEQVSPEDIREYCRDWFISQLPAAFKTLEHPHDDKHETTVMNKVGSLLPDVSIKKKEAATEFLRLFEEIAPTIRRVQNPAISDLSENELKWFLLQISEETHTLDLSNSQFANKFLLNRINHLTSLSLRNSKWITTVEDIRYHTELQDLDLSGCRFLGDIQALYAFSRLQILNLENCPGILAFNILNATGSMKSLNVRGCNINWQIQIARRPDLSITS